MGFSGRESPTVPPWQMAALIARTLVHLCWIPTMTLKVKTVAPRRVLPNLLVPTASKSRVGYRVVPTAKSHLTNLRIVFWIQVVSLIPTNVRRSAPVVALELVYQQDCCLGAWWQRHRLSFYSKTINMHTFISYVTCACIVLRHALYINIPYKITATSREAPKSPP